MNKASCGPDCKKRELTCHDRCPEFLEFKAVNEVIRKRRSQDSEMAGYITENKKRMFKRRR